MTMLEDLLPCPFCGAKEIIVSNYEFRGDGSDQYPQDVVCPNCPIGFCGHDFKGQGTAAVIAAWNKRTHAEQIERDARDAERYRWLREKRTRKELEIVLHDEGEYLDQAIDAAMSKEGE